ncbi:hypothetical protein ACN38_g2925 [Penicillium nordicum]|uniref:Uncharacterized protein n=1 Tax=Penicillium nordicum TaxID=229535 RepID=A0A0M8P954_9EURO|nr:hypothetical protein ACN38_g2925 [Penicillium nordicum]
MDLAWNSGNVVIYGTIGKVVIGLFFLLFLPEATKYIPRAADSGSYAQTHDLWVFPFHFSAQALPLFAH